MISGGRSGTAIHTSCRHKFGIGPVALDIYTTTSCAHNSTSQLYEATLLSASRGRSYDFSVVVSTFSRNPHGDRRGVLVRDPSNRPSTPSFKKRKCHFCTVCCRTLTHRATTPFDFPVGTGQNHSRSLGRCLFGFGRRTQFSSVDRRSFVTQIGGDGTSGSHLRYSLAHEMLTKCQLIQRTLEIGHHVHRETTLPADVVDRHCRPHPQNGIRSTSTVVLLTRFAASKGFPDAQRLIRTVERSRRRCL